MPRRNRLLQSPPYPVEQAMRQVGEHLRTARIRRNITIADAAERIGTGPRAVMDAEKGKGSTSVAVYGALLWLYDQLNKFEELADPSMDREGLTLQAARERQRARKGKGIDSDF